MYSKIVAIKTIANSQEKCPHTGPTMEKNNNVIMLFMPHGEFRKKQNSKTIVENFFVPAFPGP